jgi:hypothetical protein
LDLFSILEFATAMGKNIQRRIDLVFKRERNDDGESNKLATDRLLLLVTAFGIDSFVCSNECI